MNRANVWTNRLKSANIDLVQRNAKTRIRLLMAVAFIAPTCCWTAGAATSDVTNLPATASTTTDDQRNHWAFKSPVRPRLPEVKQKKWARNPIDEFVLDRLEKDKIYKANDGNFVGQVGHFIGVLRRGGL